MVSRGRATFLAVIVTLMLGLAASPAGALYRGDAMTRLLFGAIALAVFVSLVLRAAPAGIAAPVSMLALAGYCLLSVRITAASAGIHDGLAHLVSDALRNGIARLIGTLLPIEPQPDTVIVPIIAVWLAGLVTAEVTFRSRHILAGYAAPVLVYALALLFVGPHHAAGHSGPESFESWRLESWRLESWRPVAFAALGAFGLIAGHAPPASLPAAHRASSHRASSHNTASHSTASHSGSPRRMDRVLANHMAVITALAMATLLAVSAIAAPAVAAHVTRSPVDVHRVVPPRDDVLDENPLVRLSGWNLNPDEPLLRVTIDGVPADTEVRIRLAVLGDYDGITWRVGGTYRPAGQVLTTDTAAAATTTAQATAGKSATVSTRITIDELDGHLVPAVADPVTITGVRVAEDPGTGTLIRPDGLVPGLTYHVTSIPAEVDADAVADANVPSGPGVAGFLQLDGTPPPAMLRLAAQLGAEASSPYQRADAIAAFLRDHYRLVSDAPSGHAYPNLSFFLFGPRAAGGQRGTSEQFAASFAVLGRMLGLPTRVVVGFRGRSGMSTIRGADAMAWPEVLFDGVGWVPFDSLPTGDAPLRTLEQDFAPRVTPPTPPSQVPTPSAFPSTAASRPPSVPAAPVSPGDSSGALIALIAAALIVPALLLVTAWLRHLRDRRRAARGSAVQLITAAWWDVHSALRLAGRPAAKHLSATAVAAYAAAVATGSGRPAGSHAAPSRLRRHAKLRLSVPPLDDLVMLVNAITFGDTAVNERDVRIARAQAHAYVAELRSRRPWWRRVL